MLGHRWCSIQVVCPNGLRHHPCWCRACPKWCRLSANHSQGSRQCHTSRWYNHQRSPWGGELLLTPPQIKPLLWVVQVHRTMEDLTQEGGEVVANPSVAQGTCRRRQVHSRRVRKAICPPGQCQVFHHQQHLKEPSLSGEVGQGLPSAIPCDWWQNFATVVGRRTWSMCSGSITSSTLPPSRRQNGRGSRRSFSNTSSHIRRKHWASKKDARWTLWHTLKTIFIRPRASTWMALGASLAG